MNHWIITVGSWGTLYGYGTEEEAETWRRHKANWERSPAEKRLATSLEIFSHEWKPLKDLV